MGRSGKKGITEGLEVPKRFLTENYKEPISVYRRMVKMEQGPVGAGGGGIY